MSVEHAPMGNRLRRLTQSTFNNITSFYARRYTRRELLFSSVLNVRLEVLKTLSIRFRPFFEIELME